jgi:hypothetical protein
MSVISANFNDDPDSPSREERRRELPGRRAEDLMATERCAVHDEAMKRRDERCEERKRQCDKDLSEQAKVNETIFGKLDGISTKLNLVLGAAFIIWPLIQVAIQYFLKK